MMDGRKREECQQKRGRILIKKNSKTWGRHKRNGDKTGPWSEGG